MYSKRTSLSFAALAAGLLPTMFLTSSCQAQNDAVAAPPAAAAAPVAAAAPEIATPDVLLTSQPNPKSAPLSHLIGGGQFNFFFQPIVERKNNENLLNDWKAAKVSIMRYPGGTWGDHYVWDHPENSYFVANATADTILKPAEFVEMCRKVGAEPIFQANALVKGERSNNYINPTKIEDIRTAAKWAAEWVRQANIVNKWNVKYWEIGNELWIMYRPDEYATILKEYSIAMKAVDPSIKIIACGLSSTVGPFKLEWFNFKDDPNWKIRTENTNNADDWNKALFTIAKGHFDYVAPHPYISQLADKGKPELTTREIYLGTTAKVWDQTGLKGQYKYLEEYKSPAKIAVSEWATNFSYSVPVKHSVKFPMYFYSQGNGVNAAHYLGQIVSGEKNEIAILHSLDDAQNIWYWPKKANADKPLPHPIYLALKMWNTHLGTQRATTKVSKEPTLKIGDKTYPAVFTYASEDDKNVYLMAINLDPDAPHKFQWQPEGQKASSEGVLSLMAGKSLDEANWDTWNQEKHTIDIVDSNLAAKDGKFDFQLPAYSVAGITVPKAP